MAAGRAAAQLARIEAGLRKPQPVRSGDRSSIVAAILRRPCVRPQRSAAAGDGLDVLFILRSSDPGGSRWSGQVAFPGGHVEAGETDEEAVARECLEEVGLALAAPGRYRKIGRVADRAVHRPEKQSTLLVRCYVYEQLVHEPLAAEPGEVAACGWAPLDSLTSDALIEPLPPAAGGSGAWKGFPSIPLPIAEGEIVVGSAPSADAARERFSLCAAALPLPAALFSPKPA